VQRHGRSAAVVCFGVNIADLSQCSSPPPPQDPLVDGLVVSCGSLDISLQLACTILAVLAQPHLGLGDAVTAGVGNASIWHGSPLAALFERCCQILAEEMADAFPSSSAQPGHCDAEDIAGMVRQHAPALGDVSAMLRDVLRCWADASPQQAAVPSDACVVPEGETGLWWQDAAGKVRVIIPRALLTCLGFIVPLPPCCVSSPSSFWQQRTRDHSRAVDRSRAAAVLARRRRR